jgi:alpha-1,3-rhamnosyl/mannosyltransferase
MTRVTLCVDALAPQPGGIGRYTWELCKGLTGRGEISSLRFFGRGRLIDDPGSLLRGEALTRPRTALRRWWENRGLASSIVHGPNYFLPDFAESGVITVHDLSVFRFPETHPADRVRAFERDFLKSLSRAAHVITDTETVRRELIETFSVRPNDVTAVPLGVDPAFRPQSDEALGPVLKQWGLRLSGYGLCVSTLEPRKKISELLAAWRNLPRSVRDNFPLVLCGGAGWRNEQLHEQVAIGVAEGWLKHLGFVEETLLPQLYAGAALFIYPSIYEGFGLPPLEALASGVPVMVSRYSCLPEVCGDAARYFDPDDSAGFVAAIEQNLEDVTWRAESVTRGPGRAGGYSWNRCIDGTVDIYLKVASTI